MPPLRGRQRTVRSGRPHHPCRASPGSGALHLANAILPACGTLKIVRMPGETKDLRKWFNAGGEHAIFDRLTHDADLITRKVLNEKMAKLDAWKEAGREDFRKTQAAKAMQVPVA